MSQSLPPDRSHVAVEQRNPASSSFDELSTREQLAIMVRDHEAVTVAVAAASDALAAFIDALEVRVRGGGRLFYCGAGTSGRLGVLDAAECPPTFLCDPSQIVGLIAGGDAALRKSSERREDEFDGTHAEFAAHGVGARDTVVAIAAGGTTPYALGALVDAKARGALTAFLTSSAREVPRDCDHFLVLATGPEVLTGSTRLKAGSATKLALNCITTILFAKLGKIHGNLMVDLAATNDKLVDRAIRTLCQFDPALTRDAAAALLREADGRVKVAIVMRSLGLGASDARSLLDASGGSLRRALETKKNAAPR
ncbi:MAG: N-acetylmuramic acid 6-phosphate etherase [Phycisphaerales bacterium]|nr:N-acetylmuramic acid 6-phosphate etherase [Phycisphaerales bacterium]